MGFNCGIVGLPNVGKSTLFNALTKASIPAENFPFCTIDPNLGRVPVPDPRLDALARLVKPGKQIPATMEFVDIAGLVAGANKGEGLGNQFLAHIRETDAIAHVVRCFENEEVVHVSGAIDPVADIEIIETELLLADLETVEKAFARVARAARVGDKTARAEADMLEAVQAALGEGRAAREVLADVDADIAAQVRQLSLLTVKPVMYIANVAEDGFEDNPHLQAVQKKAAAEGAVVVPSCNQLEQEITEFDDEERGEFLAGAGLQAPGLDRVIRAGYGLLDLLTFFTAGPKEVRAWTLPRGATAPEAAGRIHTDFQKGFIRAELVAFEDFIGCGGEAGAKDAGKWRLEGRDYVMQDGDVVHFRFNV